MIPQSTQPDPIETLLARIQNEVEREQGRQLATFLQRAFARTIDTIIVFGVAYGCEQLALWYVKSNQPLNEDFILKSIQQTMPAMALVFWALLYSPILESMGGTVGKRLMGIQLIDLQTGQIPAFRMCAARAWIYLIFVVLIFVPAVLSCLAFFISDNHQTWHDKLTNMICVKVPKKKRSRGSSAY